MKIRKAKGADPDEIEKIGIAGYVLNGTSDVQPAIPFLKKSGMKDARYVCKRCRRTAGAFVVISYIMKKIKPASLRVLL